MYEIDLSTLILIGIDENSTKVVTKEDSFNVNYSAKAIVDHSCRYFGSTIDNRVKSTKMLAKMSTKVPIVIEETRNIIFFPLRSTREKNNIWVSFNNLDNYIKDGKNTILKFKNGKKITLNISYYIIDNQVTRSLILDYELGNRRKSLEK